MSSARQASGARHRTGLIASLGAVVLSVAGSLSAASACAQALAEPDAKGAPLTVRRLTESQYRATVADVFGADIPVVGRFEPGLRDEGLIAIGTSEAGISSFSIEQYDASARGISAAVVSEQHRDKLLPCKPRKPEKFDSACAEQVLGHYGLRLYRRPLTAQETKLFVADARSAQQRLGNFYGGLEYALTGMMVSPDFLLRIERTEPDPDRPDKFRVDAWSKATRLGYFLTDSTPDEELLRAAQSGELDTPAGLARQVDRLIASPGFERAVRAFFADLLEFELFEDLAKDPLIYPAFNSEVIADAQEQTLRTITGHLLRQKGDYRELFTTRATWLTRALGPLYRMPVAARKGWEAAEFSEASGRAGIQSHISFLALHSHPGRSSPTLRGKSVREVFLCQHVPDPPADVDFTGINDTSNKARPTARDRLEAHRTQPVCMGCHLLMDPLGLTLERFDGAGSFRTHENEALIIVSGSLDGVDFEAAPGLGQALHDYRQAPRCLVQRMYGAAAGRDPLATEPKFLDYLNEVFAADGYRVPDLMRAIALSHTFYSAADPEPETQNADSSPKPGGPA